MSPRWIVAYFHFLVPRTPLDKAFALPAMGLILLEVEAVQVLPFLVYLVMAEDEQLVRLVLDKDKQLVCLVLAKDQQLRCLILAKANFRGKFKLILDVFPGDTEGAALSAIPLPIPDF